jgi:flagellar hook-length control protein FliK
VTVLSSVIGHSGASPDVTSAPRGDARPSSAADASSDAAVGDHAAPSGPPAAAGGVGPAGSVPVTAPTSPPIPTAPATSASQPSTPAQQIVTVLTPLRSTEDGTHEVTIALEPEGLGTVKATITVNAQQVVVQLGADNDQAREALRQALPLLRHELGGGSSATVVLSDGRSQGQRPHAQGPSASSGAPGTDGTDTDAEDAAVGPMTASASRSGHIDLHL